jgi:hypothetical protein
MGGQEGGYSKFIALGWKQVECPGCAGVGKVTNWSADCLGDQMDCIYCHGSGKLWKTPKGHLVRRPGGFFF